jgi:predicted NAD/FAD-dependent oxidoreductase
MVHLPAKSHIPDPGGLWLDGKPIAWMADNHRKGVSSGISTSITIHAGPQFSVENWETPDAVLVDVLLKASAPWLGSAPLRTQIHRRRYGHASRVHADRCLSLSAPAPLVFAGDGFGGTRVEGAALSGIAASAALCGMLNPKNRKGME